MSINRYLPLVPFIIIAAWSIPAHRAKAAVMLIQQTDGSISVNASTACDNLCSDIVVGRQTFTGAASGTVGSIEVFTSNFQTNSRYPEGNSCYLTLYDLDGDSKIGTSDNQFNGYGCGGDLIFTFKDAEPHIVDGGHYRWDFVFGSQNFSSVNFIGTRTYGLIDGTFNKKPLSSAKFIVYAALEPPTSLEQWAIAGENDRGAPILESGVTADSTIALAAALASPLPDALQLQAELEPSFVPFSGMANLFSSIANIDTTSEMRITAPSLFNGGYHWQVRAADSSGNTSHWVTPTDPPIDSDFFIEDPSRGIVLGDNMTTYQRNTWPDPCFGDGMAFSCALLPSSTHYNVPDPFVLSRVTFDWRNDGSNNCDGFGNYGAVIASSGEPDSILATSTDTVYLGCGRGESGNAELHFKGETIPARFAFSFGAFDGGLQGGSDVKVSNIAFYGTFGNATDTQPDSTSTIPTSTTRESVVIVPGMLGSRLNMRSDKGEIWPNADTMLFSPSDSYLEDLALLPDGSEASGKEIYASDIMRTVTTSIPFSAQDFYAPLLGSLASSGYREGVDLFISPYDWRLDIASSAASLGSVVHAATAASPNGKINIVAHSMGALLVKEFMTHSTDTSFMDKIVLVAPPQLGAPQMFKALQYGDDLGFHVGPLELLNPKEVERIAGNMPGAYELLPSRKYTAITGGYVIDNRDGNHVALNFDETNNFMTTPALPGNASKNPALLARADALHTTQDDFLFPADKTYEIVGCGNPSTLSQFVLQDGGGVDITRTSGDGTIPVASAVSLANDYHIYFSLYSENGADHLGLIRSAEPLALIGAILGDGTSTLSLAPLGMSTSTQDCFEGRTPAARRETTIEVIAEGPVILGAHDAERRIIDEKESGVPGATYTSISDLSALMLPASDTYRISARTNATGTLTFKIRAYDDAAHLLGAATYIGIPISSPSSTLETTIVSTTTPFEISNAPTFSFIKDGEAFGSPIFPTSILSEKESEDTAPPDVTITALPQTITEGTPIILSYSAIDGGSGIATSSATIDNIDIPNGTATTTLSRGTHVFTATSIDNAGNPRIASISFTITASAPQNTSTIYFGKSTLVTVPSASLAPVRRCKPRPTPTSSPSSL